MAAAKVMSERARGVSRDVEGEQLRDRWRTKPRLRTALERPLHSAQTAEAQWLAAGAALISRPSCHVRTHHVLDIAGVIDGPLRRAALATAGWLRLRVPCGYTYTTGSALCHLLEAGRQPWTANPRARGKVAGSTP